MGAYGLSYAYSSRPASFQSMLEVARLPKAPSFFRVEEIPSVDIKPAMAGYMQVTGYAGLPPTKALDYTKKQSLRLASAAYAMMATKQSGTAPGAPAWLFLPVDNPMPRARLVSSAVVCDDPASRIGEIDIAATALVGEDLRLEPGAAGTAAVTRDLPGDIALTVDAPTRQLLVVSESYHRGWRADVDGVAAKAVPVYGDFLGVVVEKGRHEAWFRFAPESLRVGRLMTIAGLVLALALFAVTLLVPGRGAKDERDEFARDMLPEDTIAESRGAKDADAAGERLMYRVTLAAVLIILAVIAWPMILGLLYTADDLGWYHIPMRAYYAQCLAEGHNYNWVPSIHCGYYLQGEGQTGMYHPLHRLLYGQLSLTDAFNIELFLSYPMLLAGMYLLLRRWGLRRDASLFGGMLGAFSGFSLLHFVHPNMIAVFAHMPWILFCIDVSLKSGDGRKAAAANLATTLFVASQLLTGHPQLVWFSSFTALGYAAFVWSRQRGVRRAALLALAVCTGALIGAVQLVAELRKPGRFHAVAGHGLFEWGAFTGAPQSPAARRAIPFHKPNRP